MIKAIIFDCFGVLTKDWWREFCDSLDDEHALKKAHELNHQYDAGLLSLDDFVVALQKATGKDPQPIEDIFDSPIPEKNVRLLNYIKDSLKPHYKIGMISNIGTNWISDYFLTKEEQVLFDSMVLSFEVGLTKPDPKIYQMAADKLGVEPSECLFIDDIESYITAAKELGMKGIVYSDFTNFKSNLDKILTAGSDK